MLSIETLTKFNHTIKICTHDGRFHSDEVVAYIMLKKILDANNIEHVLIRTREPGEIEAADICIDIGKIYDVSILRFDHHQESFHEKYIPSASSPMSSAGLVFKHFGRLLLDALGFPDIADGILYKIYKRLIHDVDICDYGVQDYGPYAYNIGGMISSYNIDNYHDNEKQYEAFMHAVDDCGKVILTAITQKCMRVKAVQKALPPMEENYLSRFSVHPSGHIAVFTDMELFAFEALSQIDPTYQLVFYIKASQHCDKPSWTVMTNKYNGQLLKPLIPICDSKLNPDAFIQVHKNLFTARLWRLEDAVQYAIECLEKGKNKYTLFDKRVETPFNMQ